MTHFLGTHQNRLDVKGRVSIPASFRNSLRGDTQSSAAITVVLRPSHIHPCVEGWPVDAFQALASPLDAMDVFSPEHDDMAATLYCDAYPVDADREGRILLPELLVAHAGLTEAVVFMGMGRTFQIWEPARAERYRLEARERARSRGLTLPGTPPGGPHRESHNPLGQPGTGTPTR